MSGRAAKAARRTIRRLLDRLGDPIEFGLGTERRIPRGPALASWMYAAEGFRGMMGEDDGEARAVPRAIRRAVSAWRIRALAARAWRPEPGGPSTPGPAARIRLLSSSRHTRRFAPAARVRAGGRR